MILINNYKAIAAAPFGLYAVQMQDHGWTISDGMGIILTPQDEIELAGWHLPVWFESLCATIDAIKNGPHVMFDIAKDSEWTKHAIKCGATYEPKYEI